MRRYVYLVLGFAMAVTGCSSSGNPTSRSVTEILSSAKPNAKGQLDYVARFDTAAEATSHATAVAAGGGQVENLDQEGRVQRVTISPSAADDVTVAPGADLSANTPLQIVRPAPIVRPEPGETAAGSDPGTDQVAESYLTARRVTGVEQLLARFPEADGRGIKVAVLDTGIDVGIEGLFKFRDGRQKLVGLYDLTDFGRVAPTALADTTVQSEYQVGGVTMKFQGTRPAAVQSLGVLDEKKLAREYLAPEAIDIDSTRRADQFPLAVGLNADNKAAVWIDVNRDGVWAKREELTDFNTTYAYVNMRPDAGPSGARALAVSITSPTDVQFLSSIHGHGTGCALIIGGDGYAGGRLRGMAPGVELVSFVLDAAGQDVYTLDQFMKTFLKARDVGADAISVSWGFATADLASARFVADFLDKEIAAKGVVIGIAAGNDGPGLGTAAADDYIPHHGFGLGALVSEAQARNLYGWTGARGDSVVFYSSFGPTRGGRQIPDVMSPLMTLVRKETSVDPGTFYPFSGTSSATPAAIGSLATIQSLVKAKTGKKVDPRVLKLAVQASAKALTGTPAVRQGPGTIDVNAAYELYVKLSAELEAAKADPAKATKFAYDVRASVQVPGQTIKAEGIRFREFRPTASISVAITKESAELMDPLTFVDVLRVTHSGAFFATPDVVTVQTTGGKFTLQFNAAALAQPGTYTDVVTLSRADGLALLRIPVVVEIPALPQSTSDAASIDQKLGPFDTWRMPVRLERPSPLVFDGFVKQVGAGANQAFAVYIRGANGVNLVRNTVAVTRPGQPVAFTTPELPAGEYEVIAFRTFRQAAVLNDLEVYGLVRVPFARVTAASRDGDGATIAIEPVVGMALAEAKLTVQGKTVSVELKRDTQAARPGFYGEVDLGTATQAAAISLRQESADQALESFLHMSVALTDSASGDSLYRGWINVLPGGSPREEIDLLAPSSKAKVIAYPNLTRWDRIGTEKVWLDVDLKAAEPTKLSFKPEAALNLEAGQAARLSFDGAVGAGFGTLELLDAAGGTLEKLPIRLE